MNILPLIITSLLILTCVSSSFFRERQSTLWEERCYLGYMNAERKARTKVASTHYSKIKSKKEKKEKEKGLTETESTFVNRRERNQLTELSKLNIAPLFEHPLPKEHYEITARLIKELYKNTSFYKKDLEYALLDNMIKIAQENKKAQQIKDLFPQDPTLRSIFYKMAKGTRSNYPALGEYILIDRNLQKKAINFSFASIPLLIATFGEKACESILVSEREKWEKDNTQHRLSEQELTEILQDIKKKPFDYIKVKELLDFSRKAAPRKSITAIDKNTQIIIHKKV